MSQALTPEQKAAAKAAKAAEKTAAKAAPASGEAETTRDSGIVVRDPLVIRPEILPLVIELPKGASKAQIARAKVLNGYAYQQPHKWNQRKEALLAELEALKDAPDPIENSDHSLHVGPRIPPNVQP